MAKTALIRSLCEPQEGLAGRLRCPLGHHKKGLFVDQSPFGYSARHKHGLKAGDTPVYNRGARYADLVQTSNNLVQGCREPPFCNPCQTTRDAATVIENLVQFRYPIVLADVCISVLSPCRSERVDVAVANKGFIFYSYVFALCTYSKH